MSQIKKVVLAYSGGLDTSIIIPWLKENYGDPEIIAVSGDVGPVSYTHLDVYKRQDTILQVSDSTIPAVSDLSETRNTTLAPSPCSIRAHSIPIEPPDVAITTILF